MNFEIIYSADWIDIGKEYNTLTFLPFCSPGFHFGHDFKTLIASFPEPGQNGKKVRVSYSIPISIVGGE